MDYELAKELKEAGFPRHEIVWHCTRKDEAHGYCRADKPDCKIRLLSAPTLEELIEACGEETITLSGTDRSRLQEGWLAYYGDVVEQARSTGTTKSEAVARLWLALNKKSAPVAESA